MLLMADCQLISLIERELTCKYSAENEGALLSPRHFDHCDDAYLLSIREQTMLNHIPYVKLPLTVFLETAPTK